MRHRGSCVLRFCARDAQIFPSCSTKSRNFFQLYADLSLFRSLIRLSNSNSGNFLIPVIFYFLISENTSECRISHLQFQNFPGVTPLREGLAPPALSPSTAFSRARGCAPVAVTYIRPGAYILRTSSVSETFRRLR